MEIARKITIPEPDPNKFDLRTHVWDARGHLVRENLYRLFIINGTSYYERPVNSGNLWTDGNQPCGRVTFEFGPTGKIAKKNFDFTAGHIAYTPPLTGDAKLHFELEQARAGLAEARTAAAELRAEIEAIRKERESATKQAKMDTANITVPTTKQEPPTLKRGP